MHVCFAAQSSHVRAARGSKRCCASRLDRTVPRVYAGVTLPWLYRRSLLLRRRMSIPYTSGSVSQLFVTSSACPSMRSMESLLVNKGMGRGSSSSMNLETLESDVSSGKSAGAIAKDRVWASSSVRQRVAALKRGVPAPRYVSGVERRMTPELLDEIAARTMAVRFTLSALASVGDPYRAPSGGPTHP